MTGKARIIAIGLEAADPDLIDKWCEEGHLPQMASLRQRGSWRKLLSTTDLASGATWASIITGVNPAKHAMAFYHRQLQTGTYNVCKKYANDTKRDPFWLKLDQAGKKALIFDIPDSYPIKMQNGVTVVGWGPEGLNWKQSSLPPSLLKDIKSRFGSHPLENWYQARPTSPQEAKILAEKLLKGARMRSQIVKWLYQQDEWDFFLAGFAEPHWVGHHFWHITDKNHPNYDPEVAKVCGSILFEIYKEIDNSISFFTQQKSRFNHFNFFKYRHGS